MQIVMFDRQSIFIHGMKISLQQRIPGVSYGKSWKVTLKP